MKVLLTATVQSHIVQFHKPLIELLHENGYEVHVAARDNLAEKNGLKLDFVEKVFSVPFSRSPKSAENITAYRQLRKIIDEEQYDVIHCNTPVGGIITRLAARKARRLGTKVFYTAHGFHFYKGAPRKNWLVFYPIEKIFSRLTDVLVTITNEDYLLAKEKFHCRVEHIHGVGVDEKRYHPVNMAEQCRIRQNLGIPQERKLILCIGELLPNKNQQMAIHMMKRVTEVFPDALLLLSGNGPEKEKLETLIRELHLQPNVQMLGYCTCLEKYQQIADVLVSCSKREGLPLNIVEAMLSGTPVVASDNRGHRELLPDNTMGDLVAINDASAMAEAVNAVLCNPEDSSARALRAFRYCMLYAKSNIQQELREIYGLQNAEAT